MMVLIIRYFVMSSYKRIITGYMDGQVFLFPGTISVCGAADSGNSHAVFSFVSQPRAVFFLILPKKRGMSGYFNVREGPNYF